MSSDSAPKFVLYHYDPSLAAACVFAVMFGVSTLLHIFQLLRRRTWYFIPFVVGGTCKPSPISQTLIWLVSHLINTVV